MLFINKLKNQLKKIFNNTKKELTLKNTVIMFKKTYKVWVSGCVAVLVVGFFTATTFFTLALKVEVDDTLVGYVTDELQYQSTVIKIEQEVSSETGEEFKFNKTPVFSYTLVSKKEVEPEKVYDTIKEKAKNDIEEGFIFAIDDVEVGYIADKEAVLEMLNTILISTKDASEDAGVDYESNFKFTISAFIKEKTKTIEEIKNDIYLANSTTEYTVLEFDTASSIANKTGLTITNLMDYNKNIDLTNIAPGQKLKLTPANFKLNVSKEKMVSKEVEVPFEIEETDTNDLYVGTSKLVSAGTNGLNEVIAKVKYINGEEVANEVIETKIIKAPTNALVAIGIKENKKSNLIINSNDTTKIIASSAGKYSWPVPGVYKISSPYGSRWGSFHPAIDIPAPKGTPIIAADGGTVLVANKVSGGLGNCVEIKHDNGTITRYGHMSSISAKVGQRVSKGQTIGAVGSTGNSTGSHLHFELIINGTTTNPEPMLTK